MTAFSGISACVFDAYGTLFDVNAAVARCRDQIGPEADRLAELWRGKQLQYSWLRSLMRRHVDFWQITGQALDFAMAATGIDDAVLRARLMDLYQTLDAYPDAAPCLRHLKAAGLRTAILSNGSKAMLASAVDSARLGPLLDAVLSVDDVGVFKPDFSVYRLACDRLSVAPGRICFVSSNGWDAHAAADYGFQVAWANRSGQPPEALPGMIAAQLRSLSELPALLGLQPQKD
ncbi:MAG: haloacid dehalogenase type II [Reyranellaceae bacterium]